MSLGRIRARYCDESDEVWTRREVFCVIKIRALGMELFLHVMRIGGLQFHGHGPPY